jgi:hypothetical protein
MKKTLTINYPWLQLEKGQGFFIPCIDTAKTYEEGLKAAIAVRVFDAKAKPGIVKGRLGVLFARGLF